MISARVTQQQIAERAYSIWHERNTRRVRYGPMAGVPLFEPPPEQDWSEAERQLEEELVYCKTLTL